MKVRIIYIIYFFSLIGFISCIDRYTPSINTEDQENYVVYGKITNEEGYQTIDISTTSNVAKPAKNPVIGCDVIIYNDKENAFILSEISPGKYQVWMDSQYLTVGTSYKVHISTPSGTEISSDYSEMTASSEMDSIYYFVEDQPTSNPDEPIQGVQFYADIIGSEQTSKYYKYEIEETWEYHSKYPNTGYYDGEVHTIKPPDESLRICWKTYLAHDIIVLSTDNLTENKFFEFPLQYVNSSTDKLIHGYIALIKQYSLTKDAFYYWNKVSNDINTEGGLYTSQPELIEGNLHNLTNPDKKVMGYFSASNVKSKRIFIKEVPELTFSPNYHCMEMELKYFPISMSPNYWPAYWRFDKSSGKYYMLGDGCVDCTERGGTLIKPDFWPW